MKRFVIILPAVVLLVACDGLDRNKRQLMYPPESIMQLAFAMITPGEVKGRMLTTNLGVMFNINLPTNISSWYPWRTDYRRRRSTNTDIHLSFYSLIQNLLTMNGLDGRACLQKSFCQMKESPVGSHDLPHQLLNLVFGFLLGTAILGLITVHFVPLIDNTLHLLGVPQLILSLLPIVIRILLFTTPSVYTYKD